MRIQHPAAKTLLNSGRAEAGLTLRDAVDIEAVHRVLRYENLNRAECGEEVRVVLRVCSECSCWRSSVVSEAAHQEENQTDLPRRPSSP